MERIEDVGTVGYIIGTEVHILRRSSSRYGLVLDDCLVGPYCCQDGCCDMGLTPPVERVVREAAGKGATSVVLRTGQRGYYRSSIAGLPVRDVSDYVGVELPDGARVVNRWLI